MMIFPITMSFQNSKLMKKIVLKFIAYKLSQLHQLRKKFACPLCAIHKYDNGNAHIFANEWVGDVMYI